MSKPLLVWFKDVTKDDVALVGGKGANLGEMTRAGFPVPQGFILTAEAYRQFIRENKLEEHIRALLLPLDYSDTKALDKTAQKIQSLITKGKLSEQLVDRVFHAYQTLSPSSRSHALVAVRSSATAEDLPGASFAGQQETFLNVQGEANLLLKIKEAWASLFTPRAIFYRHEQGFDHMKVAIAVPVQKMVASQVSGIMFSIDPLTNDKHTIVIEAIYGLGEYIVQGKVTPDHYEVSKSTLEIIRKKTVVQKIAYEKKGHSNKEVTIPSRIGGNQKLTDAQITELATLSKRLEKHYYFPQDSEWAVEDGVVYLVQTRPVTTVAATTKKNRESDASQLTPSDIILTGDPASPGIATGPVTILKSAADIDKLRTGDVLVAPQTNPDFVPAMKKAVAIITDSGGRTSHAAIVSREIGIPAVVGTSSATRLLKQGHIVTVNGATGHIYKGGIISRTAPSLAPQTNHAPIHTATKVYVNLAEPEFAQMAANRHADGVGLLRAEFMMANIGVHPKKMIHDGKKKEYIQQLVEGLLSFCKAFSPRIVVYRASDFKTNEYRNLTGGKDFEPVEPNPMLGYRGAFRYIHDPEVFSLELEAIKIVRNVHGYKNLSLMLPFVRSVRDLEEVKKIIASHGLHRSHTFKLWMMVEIPSNVILLDQFIEAGIDGVSIGSNDLTMCLLGTDRDNSEVATEFDERNPAVLWAIEHVIKTAHAHHITSSLCGQAASQYPDLLEKLVGWGITSVSVSPDVVETTREHIARIEASHIRTRHGKN